MPKSDNQKQKLLYIEQFFRTHTDETHAATAPQIIAYLEQNDIHADRKTIYSDIETLRDFGLDIIKGEGARDGYWLASREFELAEVKLLVDLVQSAKFITTKKSRELIEKLEGLVSNADAHKLHRQVVVADRNKTVNESIYYSVDVIYTAIADNAQIRFQYFDWTVKKEIALRKDGAFYQVSPWLLTWDYENYYLVAYDAGAEQMKHYRVDKMLRIEQTDSAREGRALYEKIDAASYSGKTFGMFAGEERTLRLLCDSSLTGVVIDRFGARAAIRMYDESHILLRVDVAVSPQFYGWLAGLSDKVRILTPDVADDYQNYLHAILSAYADSNHPAQITGRDTMSLPKDPVLLLSVVNTKLRDQYPNLEELAGAHMTTAQSIIDALAQIGYHYDREHNQFK